jgi:diguanylate cyclase (GGDEF)-like protein
MFSLGIMIGFSNFAYLMEVLAEGFYCKLLWNYFQYLVNPFIAPLWLTGVLLYVDRLKKHRRQKIAAIFLFPFLTFVFRLTDGWHHLYFKSVTLTEFNGLLLLDKTPGPWLLVQATVAAILMYTALSELLRHFRLNGELKSGKTLLIFIAFLISLFGLSTGMLGLGPINYNTVFCIPLEVLLVTFAILKDDFMDVKQQARNIAFDNSYLGIITLNQKGRIIDYNMEAVRIFGSNGIVLSPLSFDRLVPKDGPLYAVLTQSGRSIWKAQEEMKTKYYELYTNELITKGELKGYIKTIRDITELQEETDILRYQASVDELSGLLNRREFLRQGELALNKPNRGPCCLIMFDIDYFKAINDSRGHLTGDYVISCVGKLTLTHFREACVCGRIGGEEFAVLIPADQEEAFKKAEELRLAFASCPMTAEGKELRATISLGIAQAESRHKITDLINMADKALYVSKNTGRNRSTIYMTL